MITTCSNRRDFALKAIGYVPFRNTARYNAIQRFILVLFVFGYINTCYWIQVEMYLSFTCRMMNVLHSYDGCISGYPFDLYRKGNILVSPEECQLLACKIFSETYICI